MAAKRLQSDYRELLKTPVDYISAHPLDENIHEWHYAIRGPNDTPFTGGVYHGKLVFPEDYPFRGPAVYMLTPNGKFQCNVRLCLSLSDFHPESWSPLWTVSTVLIGLLSFMIDDKCGPFYGSDFQSIAKQQQLAKQSWIFNLTDRIFCKYFPHLVEEAKAKIN